MISNEPDAYLYIYFCPQFPSGVAGGIKRVNMAQRRMFSPDIVESDAFLEMPSSSQSLYFHLGMRSDDDGFVNPRGVMRSCGATEDDLKILIAKRFVLPFENGVVVIKHWRVNNLVRKDWYKPTQYLEEKSTLFVKETGAYTQDSLQGIPLVNEPLTTRQHRLGKDRLITSTPIVVQEVREGEESPKEKKPAKYPHSKEVFSWFPRPQLNWSTNKTELIASNNLWERTEEACKVALAFVRKHQDDPFCPQVVKPSDLDRKWLDLLAYRKKINS